jgi:S1-C subfamily serine protease
MNKPPGITSNQEESSQGSAVAISSNILLTNCHVIKNPKHTFIFRDDAGEEVYPVRVIFQNQKADRCQLEVWKIKLQPVEGVRSYGSLQIGEKVYAIGSPRSLTRTLSEGLVSGLSNSKNSDQKLIQTSAPISPGSSGGGLFDDRGNLVGITTKSKKDSQNFGFAIAAEDFFRK